MTDRLEQAIAKVRQLSAARQEDAADLLFDLLAQEDRHMPPLTPEQIEQVEAAMRRADAGEFASQEEVEAVYNKFGA